MFQMNLHLRLTKNKDSVEFQCNHEKFRLAVIDAYNRLYAQCREGGAVLEVKHKTHHWLPAYFNGSSVTISSPLHLDFIQLRNGVYQTLKQADTWPTEAQKIIAKRQAIRREMKEEAERRRNRFFVVR